MNTDEAKNPGLRNPLGGVVLTKRELFSAAVDLLLCGALGVAWEVCAGESEDLVIAAIGFALIVLREFLTLLLGRLRCLFDTPEGHRGRSYFSSYAAAAVLMRGAIACGTAAYFYVAGFQGADYRLFALAVVAYTLFGILRATIKIVEFAFRDDVVNKLIK